MHYCSFKASKLYDKKILIISNADLQGMGNGVQKRGLQARAINALHCICFSGYLIIIIIIIIIIIVVVVVVVVVVVHISHH